MTFDQLEMLEAIIENGSFKAASVALHKSQPSLSVGIKKIEEEYGITLFNRDEYRPKLSDQGKIFYQAAKVSLDSFRHLAVIATEMGQNKVEPQIHVVMDPLVQYEDIESLFKSCLGNKSPTELSLSSAILDEVMDALLSGEVDFAIGARLKNHEHIESVFFKKVEMIPVASKKIASHYQNYPQVIVKTNSTAGALSQGLKCYVSDHALKSKLILSGHGWGRLASHEIVKELKMKSLIKINDQAVKPFVIDLYLMRNKTRVMGPMAKKIWGELS